MGGWLHAVSRLCRSARPTPPQKEAMQLGLEPILVDCYPKLRAGLPEYLLLQFRTCVFLETESCCLAVPVLYPFTDLKTIIKSFFQPSPHSFRQQPFIRCLLCTRHCARPRRSQEDSGRAPAPSIAFSPDAPTNCPLEGCCSMFHIYTFSPVSGKFRKYWLDQNSSL